MATIQDVVKLSGVSVATVSRVIHNSPNVLPATREKVLAAIRELDYHPNRLAQQFRTQRTKCVLVLLPRLQQRDITFSSPIPAIIPRWPGSIMKP